MQLNYVRDFLIFYKADHEAKDGEMGYLQKDFQKKAGSLPEFVLLLLVRIPWFRQERKGSAPQPSAHILRYMLHLSFLHSPSYWLVGFPAHQAALMLCDGSRWSLQFESLAFFFDFYCSVI